VARQILQGRFRAPSAVSLVTLGLLLIFTLLAGTKGVCAQGPSADWPTPIDISAPLRDGLDLFGVLLCDPYQNLHILWGKGHESESEIYYRTDASGALSYPRDVLALPYPLAVRLSAAISEPGDVLHLIWQSAYIKGDVFYTRVPLFEAGDARAWDEPRLLVPEVDGAGLGVDRSGALHVFYTVSDAGGYRGSLYEMPSVDSGLTWGDPTLLYEATAPVPSSLGLSPTYDEAGRMHVGVTIRSLEYGAYSEVGYLRSPDGGQSWDPYVLVAQQSETTPNVSVLAPFVFGEDEVHLTWHDPRRMHMWSSDGGLTWSRPVEMIELGAGFGGANFLAKDSAGRLHAVVSVYGGVYTMEWDGSGWGRYVQIDNRRIDPHGQQLLVCQGNQLHVVYDDRVEQDTTVWYTHAEVSAPHIPQSPIPVPEQAVAVGPTLTADAGASPTPDIEDTPVELLSRLDDTATSMGTTSLATPLLVGAASATGLLLLVLGWLIRRGGHG